MIILRQCGYKLVYFTARIMMHMSPFICFTSLKFQFQTQKPSILEDFLTPMYLKETDEIGVQIFYNILHNVT